MSQELPQLELAQMREAQGRIEPYVRCTPSVRVSGCGLDSLLDRHTEVWAKLELCHGPI